ncbi:MAG: S-layer homology domain-containing protein [Candidatus Peregrinibacteria bacterium]
MKKLKFFTFVLFLISLLPLARAADATTTFLDVPRTDGQFLSIQYFTEQKVVNGYADNTFKPENPINRAEALKLILANAGARLPTTLNQPPFSDVKLEDWFAPYAAAGLNLNIVSGDGDSKTFSAGRQVNKAELLKMLFAAHKVKVPAVAEDQVARFSDVPADTWFAPILHHAASLGIIAPSASGLLRPAQPLTRGEVIEILYLFELIRKGNDTQFLLDQTEKHLNQIEIYVAANRVDLAKKTSKLGVDLSQQTMKNLPGNNVVLGAAKLARAYDFLVDAFRLGTERKFIEAAENANGAIVKAGEAWQANNATQPIAKHIKDRAREILAQVGGIEWPNGQPPAKEN